jgi:hypothetical protein
MLDDVVVQASKLRAWHRHEIFSAKLKFGWVEQARAHAIVVLS